MTLSYTLTAEPDAADIESLEQALSDYFVSLRPDALDQPLAVFARDDAGAVVAGLAGKSGWGQLYIRTLHVAEALRGQGVGRKLMQDVEAEGRKRGCTVAWLMCSTAEAKRFYERCGYACFGEVERPAPLPARWFMKKAL